MTISPDSSTLKKKNQKKKSQHKIFHSLLGAEVVVEVDGSGDATDDDGHPPAQEVEAQDGFGGQGHGHRLRRW